MCEICAHYNKKANEMKWLCTKVKAAATRLHLWVVCQWNNDTQKFQQQQLAFMCEMGAYYNKNANWNEITIQKTESRSNLPSCGRCMCTITKRQTKWMIHTKKWKHQQLSSMCKVYVYYNNKANEMKLLYTKVEAAALAFMCEICAYYNTNANEMK